MPITTPPTPSNVELSTNPNSSDSHHEQIQVQLPASGTIPKIDVYFLVDSTGSMTSIIDAVRARVEEILNRLVTAAGQVGADVRFGVGNYRDLDFPVEQRFHHQVSLTSSAPAAAGGIHAWTVAGGTTTAEGQFFALDHLAQPPGGTIGWRAEAKRIILWIGDAPGHDPICQAVSGLTYNITEHSVISKLRAEGIAVLVISTPSGSSGPGLDIDPVPLSNGTPFQGNCTIGGTAGQGSRVAAATGGTYTDGITPATVVDTIITLGTTGITTIGSVTLVPDTAIAPFVRISPASYGPFPGTQPQTLNFALEFPSATPTAAAPVTQEITVQGAVDVVVDGVRTGSTHVKITVPDLTGSYKIRCTLSNLYLQLDDPNWTGDGANVDQNVDSGIPAVGWQLVPVPGGGYHIKNCDPARDRYLEVVGMSTENGAEVLTRSDPSGAHKQWLFIPAGASQGGPLFRIQNLHSGKVLDVRNQSLDPDARVTQQGYWGDYPTYHEHHNQHWILERI
ncbi:RICIN domain-containing protein [Lentzea jiangxiensis]|uniref:Ricin-type beta-trefoil lectin domain-like n=1 Tax=Lentzea jiangxiensis TaxID=641025 RepID=A0A1H0VQB4_9PSEU|nr:RICIN domain-containing protein [Lentzea jiangxiensis]SDP80461.1 Ricin-type beta-trefoil lectin domain-like [Lentzea jiangxiensis]